MNTNSVPAYGLWPLVIINALVFIIFAFSFTRPHTARDWHGRNETMEVFQAKVSHFSCEGRHWSETLPSAPCGRSGTAPAMNYFAYFCSHRKLSSRRSSNTLLSGPLCLQCMCHNTPKSLGEEDSPGQFTGVEPVGTNDYRAVFEVKGQEVLKSTLAYMHLIYRSRENHCDELRHLLWVLESSQFGRSILVAVHANVVHPPSDIQQISANLRLWIGVCLEKEHVVVYVCG